MAVRRKVPPARRGGWECARVLPACGGLVSPVEVAAVVICQVLLQGTRWRGRGA